MEPLFVYGTLKEAEVQKEVIGREVQGIPDTLEGYKMSEIQIEGETYPLIVPEPGSVIEGVILSVTEEDFIKLDEYETDAYKREKLILKSGKEAWVYCRS